jgi:RHS repeat-associated protein
MSSPTDASGCYGLTWTYDAWANRTNQTTSSGACTESHPTIAPNNQFTGTPYQYDAAGNMTQDASHSYTYDAENRLTTVDGGSTANYVYDAEGDRIEKIAGGVTTVYYYDPVGNLTTETNGGDTLNIGYVYSGGQLLAEYEGGSTLFVHKDHLGSTRVMTAMNGSVSDSMDYMPYGELLSGGGSTTHKFTGKERDSESGLDNFKARYDSSSLGRFMSTDPKSVHAHLNDPQAFNRYVYTRNNPLSYIDPDGKDFGKAWSDVKTFVSTIYVQASVGGGIDVKVKVGSLEAKAGVDAKLNVDLSKNAGKISHTEELGVSAKDGPVKVGESITFDTTLVKVEDGQRTGPEKTQVEVVDTIGGKTTQGTKSGDRMGVSVEVGDELHVGAEVGATKTGWAALLDAAKEVKQSLTPTPPPAAPTAPGAPKCSGSSDRSCVN